MLLLNYWQEKISTQKIINSHCPRFLFPRRKVFVTEENVETSRCTRIKVSLPLFSVLWCNWSSSCICRVTYLPSGRNDESFSIHGSHFPQKLPASCHFRSSFEYPLEVSWKHRSRSKQWRWMDRWKSYNYLNIVTVSLFMRLSCCRDCIRDNSNLANHSFKNYNWFITGNDKSIEISGRIKFIIPLSIIFTRKFISSSESYV